MVSESHLTARIALQRSTLGQTFTLDVSLDFPPGLSVLFGPSGSGKSTTLAALAGLLRPDSGRIVLGESCLFDAERGLNLPVNERRIALVFQSLALFPHLDALGNVGYGVPRTAARSERLARARFWLDRLRVAHLERRYPGSYSGGEAQRVALARALASEPRALLLDEPFSALDQRLAGALSRELSEYIEALRLPVVLVTHDRALARELGQTLTLLSAGRVTRVAAARDALEGDP